MKLKRVGCWIIFVITCLLVAPGATSAGDTEYERATLKGLRGVEVIVEHLDSETERAGLVKTTLQTDVELKLRQAGIGVLTGPQLFATPGNPFLYLNVNVFAPKGAASGLYGYSIHLSLLQNVVLKRNAAVTLLAPTWSARGRIGIVGSARLSTVREDVRDMVDEFINAWLSVNPK